MSIVHSIDSSLREKVLEHLFVGDLLRCLWRRDIRGVEVLRAEVDRGGYDLVLEYQGIIRHVQLKSSYNKAKTADQKISLNLARKPSGCVIWLLFDPDSMELGPFLWFGNEPGLPLPLLGDKVAKHSKGTSEGLKNERANHRVVGKGKFTNLPAMNDVIEKLFLI